MSNKEKKFNFRRRWRHMSKRQKTKFIINSSLAFLCIICIGVFIYAYPKISSLNSSLKQIQKDTDIEDPDRIADENDDGYWNIVLFGLDSRDASGVNDMSTSNYGDKRSDCIIVVSINRDNKDVKLLSIYRDTCLSMRDVDFYDGGDYTYSKATHAYSWGSANTLPNNDKVDAGPYFSIDMLERNLDIQIDNFVSVNFGVVASVIDAVGGVEIELDNAEVADINQYINEINNITGSKSSFINSPGTYTLDGVQATAYGRIRHTAGDDYKRTFRQRTVLMLTAKKAQTVGIDKLLKLVEMIAPNLRTDLTNDQIITLVNTVRKFNIDSESGSAGFPFNKATNGRDSYVYPIDSLEENVVELHKYLYNDENYSAPSSVQELSNEIAYMYSNGSSSNNSNNSDNDDKYIDDSDDTDNTWYHVTEEPSSDNDDSSNQEDPEPPVNTTTSAPIVVTAAPVSEKPTVTEAPKPVVTAAPEPVATAAPEPIQTEISIPLE